MEKENKPWVNIKWDSFAEKLKTNVVILAGLATFLTFSFGSVLVSMVAVEVSGEILALLVGIGIGGLLTAVGSLLTPPPDKHGPCVPAEQYDNTVVSYENVVSMILCEGCTDTACADGCKRR